MPLKIGHDFEFVIWHDLGSNKGVTRGEKRYTVEQIIGLLCQVKIQHSEASKPRDHLQRLGTTTQTHYRWPKQHSGMNITKGRRTIELKKETARLKRRVAEPAHVKVMYERGTRGKLLPPCRCRH